LTEDARDVGDGDAARHGRIVVRVDLIARQDRLGDDVVRRNAPFATTPASCGVNVAGSYSSLLLERVDVRRALGGVGREREPPPQRGSEGP
jgi:hypothetical protein